MQYNWHAKFGRFTSADGRLVFEGGKTTTEEGQEFALFANLLCNATLSDGRVSAKIEFADTSSPTTCGFIVRDNPETGAFLLVGLGGGMCAYSVRAFDGRKWSAIADVGDFNSLLPERAYDVLVTIDGGRISLHVDQVLVLRTVLPFRVPAVSQVGIWCQSESAVTISDFAVESTLPVAFVIMQYSQPYDELYKDVIVPVCAENGITAKRADETFGPGMILQDVISSLVESSFVIAEITPQNQNVFYELGYAHALGKPTVLIAEREKQLPFDISGHRTLFYDNSIGGKGRMEAELRKHLRALMSNWGFPGQAASTAAQVATGL